jgi:hypothetical protein
LLKASPKPRRKARLSYRMRLIIGSEAEYRFLTAAAEFSLQIRRHLEKLGELDKLPDAKAKAEILADRKLMDLFAAVAELRCDEGESPAQRRAQIFKQLN